MTESKKRGVEEKMREEKKSQQRTAVLSCTMLCYAMLNCMYVPALRILDVTPSNFDNLFTHLHLIKG